MIEIIQPGGFDYNKLDPQVASTARDAAAKIRGLVKNTVGNIIETGDALRSIKDQLDHGEFGEWIVAEFGLSIRTAQRYMQAAEWAKDKSDTVSYLEPTSLYLLAAPSTPPEAEKEVLEQLAGRDVIPHSQITAIVAEAKYRAKLAKEEAKLTPRQRRTRAEREKKEAERRAQWEREREEHERARRDLADFLRQRLGDEVQQFVDLYKKARHVDLRLLEPTPVAAECEW